MYVDVGDTAVPGAVLLEIDPADYRLAVAEARLARDAELARLGLTDLPADALDVEAVPTVRKARLSLENANTRFQMRQDLFERKVLAKEEYDLSETEYKVAEATHRDAVTQAQAVLATARLRQAALDTAEQRLRDCRLVVPAPPGWEAWAAVVGPGASPVRYTVARRYVSEGQRVVSMPVTDAFRLVIDVALKLKADVPERYTAEVAVGQPVAIRVDAYPGRTFAGRVARISPAVDPRSRTFAVQIDVPNLDDRLRPGGFARAEIRTGTDAAVPVVPADSVVTFAGVTKIFVIDDGTARPIEVDLGRREGEAVEVIGDVPAGAVVITSGHSQLVAGSPVKVRE